jgi:streptogramin lyase
MGAMTRVRGAASRRRGPLSVALLCAAVALLATACGSSGSATSDASGTLTPSFGPVPSSASVAPFPDTSKLPSGVLASITVGGGPLRMAAGFGSLWVATHRDTFLYRIDPATNEVTARIDVGQESCGTPGIGFGRVWALGCDPGTANNLVVVDPSTNQVVGGLPYGGLTLGFGDGDVWAPFRIDPETLEAGPKIHADGGDVVFGGGSVWVADGNQGIVSQVDPRTGRVVATLPAGLPQTGESYASFGSGKLWIYPGLQAPAAQDAHDAAIWEIDPRTDKVTERTLKPLSAFDELFGGATFTTGAGSLWVRDQGGKVHRFDAQTLKPLGTYAADPTTSGFVTVAFGSLWFSNLDAGTVWRVRI